jgi:hypothetical protein
MPRKSTSNQLKRKAEDPIVPEQPEDDP